MNPNSFILSSNLPKILNQNEILLLFEDYQKGNHQARNIIIERNLRLIRYIINKYFKEVPIEEEELFSIGMIGLIKSVDTFNLTKKTKFPTYASKCIYNEILMFLKKEQKHTLDISMESSTTYLKDDEELLLKNTIKDERINIPEEYEAKEEYELIRDLIELLPERDKQIIKLYFGFIDNKPKTQPEIANMYGVNQSLISRRITKSLEIITLELEKYDYVIKRNSKRRYLRQKQCK